MFVSGSADNMLTTHIGKSRDRLDLIIDSSVGVFHGHLDIGVARKPLRFLEDLYYRLRVFAIDVAPPRSRKEDIPLLVMHSLEQHISRLAKPAPVLKKRPITELLRYGWPGKIREPQNVIERSFHSIATCTNAIGSASSRRSSEAVDPTDCRHHAGVEGKLTHADLQQLERNTDLAVQTQHGWKTSGSGGAAEFLGTHAANASSRFRVIGVWTTR